MDFRQKLQVGKEWAKSTLTGSKIPISVHLAITNNCYLHCHYCGFFKKEVKDLDTRELTRIIKELAKAGTKRLHLTGGEPLIRQDIDAIVKTAKDEGLYVTLATAGFTLEKKWPKIRDVDLFFLSLDGPEEIHEIQRGRGSYKVFAGARDFLAGQGREFWTTTVISKVNQAHMDYIVDQAVAYDSTANFYLIYLDRPTSVLERSMHRDAVASDFHMESEEKKAVIRRLIERKRGPDGKHIGSSLGYFELLLQWDDLNQIYREENQAFDCKAGQYFCYIDGNGGIYACGEIMGKVEGISLLENSVTEALRKLPPIPCHSCIVGCYVELNLLFSFNLNAMRNWLFRV